MIFKIKKKEINLIKKNVFISNINIFYYIE